MNNPLYNARMNQKREGYSTPSPLSSPTKIQKNSIGNQPFGHVSPSKKSQSHQKVTIILTTPPRSVQRNTTPLSSSPKRVRFSIPGEPEPVSPIRRQIEDGDVARITLDSDYQSPMKRNTLRRYVHFKQVLHGNVQQKVSLPSEPDSSFQFPVLPKPVPYYKLMEQQVPEKSIREETMKEDPGSDSLEEEEIPRPPFVLEEGLSEESCKRASEIEFSDEEEGDEQLEEKQEQTEEKQEVIEEKQEVFEEKQEVIEEKQEVIEEKQEQLEEKQEQLEENHEQIEENHEQIEENQEQIEEKQEPIEEKQEQLEENHEQLVNHSNNDNQSTVDSNTPTSEAPPSFFNRIFSFFKRLYSSHVY